MITTTNYRMDQDNDHRAPRMKEEAQEEGAEMASGIREGWTRNLSSDLLPRGPWGGCLGVVATATRSEIGWPYIAVFLCTHLVFMFDS